MLQGRSTRQYSNTRGNSQRQSSAQPHCSWIYGASQPGNSNLCLVTKLSQDNQHKCTEENTVVSFILNNVTFFPNVTAKSMGAKQQE